MAIDYGKILGDLKDAITGTVKAASQDFLDQHKDAKDFLEAQAKDLSQLGVDYLKAADDDARAKIEFQMKLVTQYVGNLQTLSQQAAQYGGEEFAPLVMVNQIKNQRRSIVEHLNELAGLMSDVYEVQVEGVDELAAIADAS